MLIISKFAFCTVLMGFFSKLLARLSQNISALFIIGAHEPAGEFLGAILVPLFNEQLAS
jgi:membrane glycosyltransferase